MKRHYFAQIALGIFILFLIQMAGTLVESIYILDLMNTSLDEKVLGLLFFFTPAAVFLFKGKHPQRTVWGLFGILVLARGLTPYLSTLGRLLGAGVAAGAALTLLPFLLSAQKQADSDRILSRQIAPGLALAVGLSVLLRTINFGLDYSLFPEGGWTGWALGALLGYALTQLDWDWNSHSRASSSSPTLAVIGVYLVVGLAWFAFSAPAVIARWTEGDYRLIVPTVSLLALAWAALSTWAQAWLKKIGPIWLLLWNLSFTLSLLLTLLSDRVPFPPEPNSPAVVIGSPPFLGHLALAFTLLLFPVIFLDLERLTERIRQDNPTPRDLVPGSLLGGLALVLLVLAQIFSNVWGYVEPISPWFRNKFWLPFTLMAGLVTLLVTWKKPILHPRQSNSDQRIPLGWTACLGAIFLGTLLSALLTTRVKTFTMPEGSIEVMTYNIQGANDDDGERSYRQQLDLIRQVDPDILALQESDTLRVSLNNNDYVRYYAGKLGYYSYFGPSTVAGTYGTAILSKYPLENTRTVFTFSDQDEIGTAEAEVELGGRTFTIYCVHPDGSDQAMLVWARSLLDRSRDKPFVIALGDYNLRDYEEAYQLIDSVYTNAWVSVYPSQISPDGTDMSGDNRIDHIFFSPSLEARDPVYLLPPASATDHPAHWARILWKE